ncbi:DUF6241 domain-containing protein [Jeotgalibacillus proteolyticus]|uniref:CTP synthase n=1 Tax=Jeotgalibacillus proteolyticus TaxID=2082395 RepID=A0A2S5GFP5_9BACL|nr:DUF6241 domain-containing protein [Jeotgalibacillus proteolyticus]PPA71857.1 hypothetical protein C4B60_00310 [Jeotgalibacillus proteolyticus]
MTKKKLLIIAGAFVLLVGLAWGTYEWLDRSEEISEEKDHSHASAPNSNAKEDSEDERAAATGAITDEELAKFEEEGLNPFNGKVTKEEAADYQIQDYIHGMSHQKVKAKEKWGYYEIHPVRIQWLLEAVEESNNISSGNAATYKAILQRWESGDFSQVDKDHNTIWRMQDGTIGEATGILTPEQEQKYIDSMSD